jgi:small subunit ribosomal protein S5
MIKSEAKSPTRTPRQQGRSATGDRAPEFRTPKVRNEDRSAPKEKDRLNGATILMRRVSKTRARGRIGAMSATVVTGDGMGRVAVATASSKEAQESLRKARMQAEARMQSYQVWNKRTLPYDIVGRYGVVKIIARRARAGTGIIASDTMRAIFEAAGIKDVVAKVIKGRNPLNIAHATINALDTIRRSKNKDIKEDRESKENKGSRESIVR